MKKILLLTILSVSLSLVSCSKDDDNYSSSDLIGEWYLTHEQGYYYWNGEREDYNESHTQPNSPFRVVFYSDGTCKSIYVEDDDSAMGGWNMDGNKLTIYIDGDTQAATIKKLTSSTLIIQYKGSDEDGPFEQNMTLRKVNE